MFVKQYCPEQKNREQVRVYDGLQEYDQSPLLLFFEQANLLFLFL